MKTKLLVVLLLFCALLSKAQIQITRQDFPMAGDSFTVSNQTETLGSVVNYEAKGANQSWDYSALTGGINDTIRYIARTAWTGIDSFPNSTLVERSVHGVKFFSEDNNSIRLAGKIDSVTLGFYPPIVIANFPITFNATSTSSGTTINSSLYDTDGNDGNDETDEEEGNFDSVRINTLHVHYDTADAWGTIRTPVRQFEVLRA